MSLFGILLKSDDGVIHPSVTSHPPRFTALTGREALEDSVTRQDEIIIR